MTLQDMPMNDDSRAPARVRTRWPELVTAGFLMALAALAITDSLRVGIGWGDDGPRSGYFPFYIGVLLLASSGWVFLGALWRWSRETEVFAETSQLRSVAAVAVPMVVFVGGVQALGIYVASIVLIGYFMRRHGRFGWALTAAVSVGVPLVFYGVFERWFLVPLPKGPLERLLGL